MNTGTVILGLGLVSYGFAKSVGIIPTTKTIRGKVSKFGGANDPNSYEGACAFYPNVFYYDMDTTLPYPANMLWCAMRWNYTQTGKNLGITSVSEIKEKIRQTVIYAKFGNRAVNLYPVDWGPARWTNRVLDISPMAMNTLKCKTDDIVEVTIPKWMELS